MAGQRILLKDIAFIPGPAKIQKNEFKFKKQNIGRQPKPIWPAVIAAVKAIRDGLRSRRRLAPTPVTARYFKFSGKEL